MIFSGNISNAPGLQWAARSYSDQTFRNYSRIFSNFIKFLVNLNIPVILPATTSTLIAFISHLHTGGKKHSTISSYLSAIGTFHKLLYDTDPTKSFLVVRSLLGLKKSSPPNLGLLPIRFNLLIKVIQALQRSKLDNFLQLMTKAIFLLAYHGCFRIGELVWSQSAQHTLSLSQVTFNHSPKSVILTLPSFKHSVDPVEIIIPSSSPHCPVGALEDYLDVRPRGKGPLFLKPNGDPVKREDVVKTLKDTLTLLVPDTSRYITHSFRIGRTTDLVSLGTPDSVIRETGRWRSDAFKSYIKSSAIVVPEPPSVRE